MNRQLFLACTRILPSCGALLLTVGLAMSALPAHAGGHTKSSGPINPALIYHNYCSVCHGDKGDGKSRAQNSLNPPPRDFSTPAAAQFSRARMIDAVANGRPGTAMTAWKGQLNAQEIAALVDYIRNNFMAAALNEDGSRGRIVYSKNCSVCHGEKGDGKSRAQYSFTPPPRDFTSPAARSELTEQRMITSVTYGRPDTAMSGFKQQLSAQDIRAVVAYIRAGFMSGGDVSGISGVTHGRRPATPDGSAAVHVAPQAAAPAPVVEAAAPNMKAAMPQGLKGDIVKGGAFYMSNCATCHGTNGDGRGPRAYFIMPKPRNFLHQATRAQFNRPTVYKAVAEGKLGTEMPAWSQVLSPQEIADVSEFVFQRFLQPPKAAAAKATPAR